MNEVVNSQPRSVESVSDKEKSEKEAVVLEKIRGFLEKLSDSNRDKFLAQYKLFLRNLSGNGFLSGSGIEKEDAHLLTTPEETGFLELGKLHSKGPTNEGTVDFFDRYGWIGATTKFADLLLIFQPGTHRVDLLNENPEQLSNDEWSKIDKIGFDRADAQGLRRANDLLFVVFDPQEEIVAQAAAHAKQVHPELSEKILTIAEFAGRLSDRGLLPGELPNKEHIDLPLLIDEVLSLPINESKIYQFLVDELLPTLSPEQRVSVIAKMLNQDSFVPIHEFVEQFGQLGLLKKVADQLSEQELVNVMLAINDGYRPDKALPLVYLKYSKNGLKLPKKLRELVVASDQVNMIEKFAQASESDWPLLEQQIRTSFPDLKRLDYFFQETDPRSFQDKQKIASMRADFDILSRQINLSTLRREILRMNELPLWKRFSEAVRQKFTGEFSFYGKNQKIATAQFREETRKAGSLDRDINQDIKDIDDYLGNAWTNKPERRVRPLRLEPSAEKIARIQELIPTVVPDLAERLQVVLKYYSKASAQ